MATSAWEQVRQDTIGRIEEIIPTFDSEQTWRCLSRPLGENEVGRDREFLARRSEGVGEVAVFGGGVDQLCRDLALEVFYIDGPELEDRRACDEADLVAALEPRSGYPSGSWGMLAVRRVMRESINISEPSKGSIKVTFNVRLIWREPASHI